MWGGPASHASARTLSHSVRVQVKLAGGMLIFAPMDNDDTIRSLV